MRAGRVILAVLLVAMAAEPASAHHLMGGVTPATFWQGLVSGLGHPVIGLDHFAAVVAIGCLAAPERSGSALIVGFIAAMMCGVALHVRGTTVPAAEILVALSVLALGVVTLQRHRLGVRLSILLFAVAGLINGYALGESIYGAETTPLWAYLIGLAAIQLAVALGAMTAARYFAASEGARVPVNVRLIGAGVIGVGLVVLMKGLIPGA